MDRGKEGWGERYDDGDRGGMKGKERKRARNEGEIKKRREIKRIKLVERKSEMIVVVVEVTMYACLLSM